MQMAAVGPGCYFRPGDTEEWVNDSNGGRPMPFKKEQACPTPRNPTKTKNVRMLSSEVMLATDKGSGSALDIEIPIEQPMASVLCAAPTCAFACVGSARVH